MGALSIPYSQGDAADRSFAYPADSTNLPLLQTILLHGAQADTSPWVGLGLACHGAAATRTKTSRLFCAIKWKTSSCYFLFPPQKKSQFHRLKAHMTAHCMWTRLLCTCPGKQTATCLAEMICHSAQLSVFHCWVHSFRMQQFSVCFI